MQTSRFIYPRSPKTILGISEAKEFLFGSPTVILDHVYKIVLDSHGWSRPVCVTCNVFRVLPVLQCGCFLWKGVIYRVSEYLLYSCTLWLLGGAVPSSFS